MRVRRRRRPRPHAPAGRAGPDRGCRSATRASSSSPVPSSAAVAAQAAPSSSRPSARACAQSEISSARSRTASTSPALRDPDEPVRVEVVAEQERRVRVGRGEEPRTGEVDQVALVDRLDPERVARRRERREDRLALGVRSRRPRPRAGSRRPRPPRSRPRDQPPRTSATAFDRAVDLVVGVREGDEHALELRRRDVDPALEQAAEQHSVAVGVAALGVREPRDRPVGGEEGRHRADALDARRTGAGPPRAARRGARAARRRRRRAAGAARRARPRSRAGSRRACRPGRRRRQARAGPSRPRARRTRRAAGRRRRSCRGSSGPAGRRSAPARRRARRGSR